MGLLNDRIKYFLFPEQIDECANWLGLETPVPKLNEEESKKKPSLTDNQIKMIVEKYHNDNELYLKTKENYHGK